MTQKLQPPILSREDYDAIEAAVMETARGRWFLSEYARRNRNADTSVLLDAISRLERSLDRAESTKPDLDLRRELTDMAESIHQTKKDLAHSLAEASGDVRTPAPERALEDVVEVAESALKRSADATEHVQEIAWALREGIAPGSVTSDLDDQTLQLQRASQDHALTTTRVRSIVAVLREMEGRIHSLMGGWGGDLPVAGSDRAEAGSRRRVADVRDTSLVGSMGSLSDDIVFVDTSGWTERRVTPALSEPAPPQPAPPASPPALLPAAEPPVMAAVPAAVPAPLPSAAPQPRTHGAASPAFPPGSARAGAAPSSLAELADTVEDVAPAPPPSGPFATLESMPEIRRMVVFV